MTQQTATSLKLDVTNLPHTGWIRTWASDENTLDAIQRQYGVSLKQQPTHAIEEAGYTLLPIVLTVRDAEAGEADSFRTDNLLIAFNSKLLITVEPDRRVDALNYAQALTSTLPDTASTHDVLLLIIEALHDAIQDTVAWISLVLNELSDEAVDSSGGFKFDGRQVGVADIAQTAIMLREADELVSRVVEGQLMLERATRWMSRSTSLNNATTVDSNAESSDAALNDSNDSTLLSDIQGGRRHARFQHSRVRNIQQSLMTTLDLKQNQVIKVFTVITAVFSPPTLIASYYGQNFARMPELNLPWGEWFVMGATAFFALAPLVYIKWKGWLR